MDGMDWASRGRKAWMGGAVRPEVAFVSGHGTWLTDSDDKA